MGRFQAVATRLSIVGALALVVGSSLVAGVVTQALTTSAFADTAPYEIYCPNTPTGNVVLNDVTLTGSLSPANPTTGQQFSLTGLQTQEKLPAAVVQEAEAAGLTSLTGTIETTVDATGATPASISTGPMSFDVPIPNPVPASGVSLAVPSTPATVGPFTATSANISLSSNSESETTFQDAQGIGLIDLECVSYANDSLPQSGFTSESPPGLPISPVIATAGQTTPPPTSALTGPYELYCPHTPVGDLVLNDVVTTATISPQSLSAGEQFDVTGYKTHIPLPAGLASAAAGLGNTSFNGLAASSVDAYGATPSQSSTGSMAFDVPIPSPVPASGLGIDFPASPTTVGPFTASGGPVTIAQNQSTVVVAALSNKAFKMSCTAYPNDSVPASGSTGTAPEGPPIRPVIATASASGTASTTITTPVPPLPPGLPITSTGPYEMYCPGSPVGDLVLNDTATTASLSPSTLSQGQQFQLANLQTQFSIPQAVAQQAESLGLTQISGDASIFLDTTGVTEFGQVLPVALAESGPIQLPYPYPNPYGSVVDMPFDVTLPNPVPAAGVQFVATPPPGSVGTFTAVGGPIAFDIAQINLSLTEFGDSFGLFCTAFPNDTEPTGITASAPTGPQIEPVIVTGDATVTPPPPVGPGGEGPYELYCPGTPVGNVVLNDVTTSATLSPAAPAPGDQFSVTGYQVQVPLPASIASAAAALGNSTLAGNASTTVDAAGASPSSISTGALTFDVPLPQQVPASGVTLTVPSTPATLGPFTASSSAITIAQNADISLVLVISGSNLNLSCTAYPDDSAPSGISSSPPGTSPVSPVIVTAGQPTTPPTTPTVPPTTPVTVPPGQLTGLYELYCPGTPVGNVVLNDVTTSATIPADLSSGQSFSMSGFQTQVALPSSIVSAAAALGNSAITGSAVVHVDATGATPASVSSGQLAIDAPIPSPVPASGLVLELPSSPGTVGPFTASGANVTLAIDPDVSLSLVVSGSTLTLTCKPYRNDSAPSGIASSAPAGTPISPVIATSATTETVPPPTIVGPAPTTSLPSTPTTSLPSTPTTETSSDSAAVTQAFDTLFDPSASIADRVAVIQDGSSVQSAFSMAFSSSLSASATGAKVDDVSFPDSSSCTQTGLTSPCAQVTYDILGTGGTALLPDNQGYAVSVDGTWLVATNTVCTLLGLFYQAEGQTGNPPGCPAPGSSTTPSPTTVIAPTSATTSPASTPDASATTTPDGTPPTTAPPAMAPVTTDPSTSGAHTGVTAGTAGPSDPSGTSDPVVSANAGALAFTGLGALAQWLAVLGGALMILGFVLLAVVDTPRRVMYRLATLGPGGRRSTARAGGDTGDDDSRVPNRSTPVERLWIPGA